MQQTWHDKIRAAHLAVTDQVSHSKRLKSDRYFVWQEDGANDFDAGGAHAERAVAGSTDLFTKQEFDPWARKFEKALDAAPDIAWALESVQYEEETGVYHYEWTWEVLA